jgi:hypothetical protein
MMDKRPQTVQAHWARLKTRTNTTGLKMDETVPVIDTLKKALSACLKRIKETGDEKALLHLTEQIQRIVFRKQYQDAKA